MLGKRAARGVFDLGERVFVVVALNDLAKRDSRREVEELFAAQQLPRKLIDERQPLTVRAIPAEPGDGILHGGGRDHAADDGDENLQVRHMLQKDFQTARPVMELTVRAGHEFRFGFDVAAWEEE